MGHRNWDQGYSFRSADFAGDRDQDDGRPCARGAYCAAAVLVLQDGGSYAREPRPGPRTFCDADRGLILEKLDALPDGYERLGSEMHHLRRLGSSRRVPFGPSLPLHEGMDALRREMASGIAAWHGRVAAVLSLTPPDPELTLTDGGKILTRAAEVLTAGTRIDTLLGLEPRWMTRHYPAPSRQRPAVPHDPLARPPQRLPAPDWLPTGSAAHPRIAAPRRADPLPADLADALADLEIVRVGAGYLSVLALAGGADAGLDIFSLHRRCELMLGEVRQQAEPLEGVPCRECDDMALERAEPPSDPSRPAMYSVCASCHHMMSLGEYRAWAAWYSKWADGAALVCRRCQLERHSECLYERCQCVTCVRIAA